MAELELVRFRSNMQNVREEEKGEGFRSVPEARQVPTIGNH